MKNIYILCLLNAFIPVLSMEQCQLTIKPYNKERDWPIISKILDNNPQYLQYESQGYPAGTTEKYINSEKYTTVVAQNDKNETIIGFINYIAHDINLLTFHWYRGGAINLIGIDESHQGKGYGKQLLQHAIDELKKEKVSKITLMVKSDNKRAIALYKKIGFTCPYENASDNVIPLSMTYDTGILTDYHTHGNIIQKNPNLSLTLAAAGLAALVGYTKMF